MGDETQGNVSFDGSAALGKAVERAQNDPSYKAKLVADPHAALIEVGLAIPRSVTVKVVENTPDLAYLVLPAGKEVVGELSQETLATIAAGTPVSTLAHMLPPQARAVSIVSLAEELRERSRVKI